MRKKLVLLTCLLCLVFSNVVFASDIKETKVDTSSSKETLAIMESQLGQNTMIKSLNISPSYDNVGEITLRWNLSQDSINSYQSLGDGRTAYGYCILVEVDPDVDPKLNFVSVPYDPSYFDGINSFEIIDGVCDDVVLKDNICHIYNPASSNESGTYDLKIRLIGNTPFTNNTGNPLPMNVLGYNTIYSSGTELLDILVSYFTVNQVVVILSAAVGSCITLVFMWWGVRKMVYAIMSAFKKGKLRI